MKNNYYVFRTYVYRGSHYELHYSSRYRKGSRQNYDDLMAQQNKSYGRFGTIKTYEDYKNEIDKIYIYE